MYTYIYIYTCMYYNIIYYDIVYCVIQSDDMKKLHHLGTRRRLILRGGNSHVRGIL